MLERVGGYDLMYPYFHAGLFMIFIRMYPIFRRLSQRTIQSLAKDEAGGGSGLVAMTLQAFVGTALYIGTNHVCEATGSRSVCV